MYYVDPSEPNLNFVREVEKVREYFNTLTQTKLSKQTVLNYWKSLKRFMRYIVTSTSIRVKDPSLYNDCKSFTDPLDGIRAGMSKKVNKEQTQKRFRGYGKEKFPADCITILDAAYTDFLAVMGKLQGPGAISGEELSKNERLLVLYYLEAIIMLKLLQRPGVVTNMTVEEWKGRTRHPNGASVAVKEHKTAASQIAEVPLTDDQEHWFGLYFDEIRPVMLQGNKSVDNAAAEQSFFVSSTGRPIYNPCNDLKRFHAKYNIPRVTSSDARTAFETAAKNLPEVQRNAVARLLGHTPETAEKHYRMKTPADAFLAKVVVDELTAKTRGASSGASGQEKRMDEQTAFDLLVQSCPVTLDGPPPKRARRHELCAEHERHCYDRWRSEQLKLREQRVLEYFGRCQLSESQVEAWVEKQGWTSNVPQASLILKKYSK
ncbi:uncharacterized protein LOC127507922 [Ctenopharyngodon idella]|uniref:uncharacterized protein LOC127507922 n=1 Tax=Ctenopharyngodon idella TaxID=7959 RepID=UPI00223172BA|nr:uncharacterized protein LOC127507922 [Ctenopharyngodon idella]